MGIFKLGRHFGVGEVAGYTKEEQKRIRKAKKIFLNEITWNLKVKRLSWFEDGYLCHPLQEVSDYKYWETTESVLYLVTVTKNFKYLARTINQSSVSEKWRNSGRGCMLLFKEVCRKGKG